MTRANFTFIIIMVSALFLVACGDDGEPEGPTQNNQPPQGDGGVAPAPDSTAPKYTFKQCMKDKCASEQSACDSSCQQLLSCMNACGTESCLDSCIYSYSSGAPALLDLLGCADDNCSQHD